MERSAGGVVLRRIEGVVQILLIRDPYHNWGLPKGHLEPGESSDEAALREVIEETGLRDLRLGRELRTIDWYFQNGGVRIHKFCTFFVMRSDRGDPVPERAEGITECLWLPPSEAEARIIYDNAREVVAEVRRFLESDAGADDVDDVLEAI